VPRGYGATRAAALNDAGQVAGTATGEDWAQAVFRWDPRTGATRIPGSFLALAMNNKGQVTGLLGPQRGFRWHPGTGLQRLAALSGGDPEEGPISWPAAINDRGQIAGHSIALVEGANRGRAVLWDRPTEPRDLGTLPGFTDSAAVGVNERGQVAGAAWSAESADGAPRHAFVWDPVSGMRDLGTLGGSTAEAVAINARGQVAGVSSTAGGRMHGFVWGPKAGMRDLGPVTSVADLNDRGQVVGAFATGSGRSHAFLWDPATGMTDLGVLRGHTTSTAVAINERGQVAGQSGSHAVLWSPRASIRAAAVANRSKLLVDVDPNLGSGSWRVTIQKQRSNRTWATLATTYTTQGPAETRTINLPKGTYRAVVKPQYGYRSAASTTVRILR
jgi:probable HAF family extracellular repeat protein